jgi:CBS domain-containing protein
MANVVQAGKTLIEARDMPGNVVDVLERFNVSHSVFPKREEIITVKSTDSILSAFQTLIDGKVLSVPIIGEESGVVVGIISYLDFVAHFLSLFQPEELQQDKFTDLLNRTEELKRKTLKEMPEIAELDPVYSVRPEALAIDVAKIMVEHHAHRVLVTDENSKLVTIVTQSHLLHLLAGVIDSVRVRAERSIRELNLGNKHVVSIRQDQLALDAFRLMKEKKVSAVAVVDEGGRLVDTISATDLRSLGYKLEYFDLLSKTAKEYVDVMRATKDKPFVVCCKEDDDLAYALKLLLFWKVHRVFVTDRAKVPVSVLSLYDILNILVDRFAL